jgi:hypothetical protein
MPGSTRQQPNLETRHAIDTLWKHLVELNFPLSGPDEISFKDEDLRRYGISRISFDFGGLVDDRIIPNSGPEPPILFRPLPHSTLKNHPIDMEKVHDDEFLAQQMDFLDYDRPSTDSEHDNRGHIKRAREALCYLEGYAGGGFPRTGIPAPYTRLRNFLDITPIGLVFLSSSPSGMIDCNSSQHPKSFPAWRRTFPRHPFKQWLDYQTVLEYRKKNNIPVHPHLILMTMQSSIGREDSILLGELAPIITAMRNRAFQPLTTEGEEDDLFTTYTDTPEDLPEALSSLPLAFAKETRFPVLLVSLLGSQHGRLFYACMDGQTLVIRQSKLYSFEKKDTAPWEFFSRLILSAPLKELSTDERRQQVFTVFY